MTSSHTPVTLDQQKALANFGLSMLSNLQVVEDPDHTLVRLAQELIKATQGQSFELPTQTDPNVKFYGDLMAGVFPDPTIIRNQLALLRELTKGLCEYDPVEVMAGTLMKLADRLEAMLAVHKKLDPRA